MQLNEKKSSYDIIGSFLDQLVYQIHLFFSRSSKSSHWGDKQPILYPFLQNRLLKMWAITPKDKWKKGSSMSSPCSLNFVSFFAHFWSSHISSSKLQRKQKLTFRKLHKNLSKWIFSRNEQASVTCMPRFLRCVIHSGKESLDLLSERSRLFLTADSLVLRVFTNSEFLLYLTIMCIMSRSDCYCASEWVLFRFTMYLFIFTF